MYLYLIERKFKTTSLIFKLLTFLNQDFSSLNFDIILFIICFILALLFNFVFVLTLFGQGQSGPLLRVYAKYLKNSSIDLHQTF